MIRPQDEVKVQDLCAEEQNNSYDLVFMPFPSRSIDRPIDPSSYEMGILRNDDLVFRAIEQVGNVLTSQGEFVFFYRVFNDRFPLCRRHAKRPSNWSVRQESPASRGGSVNKYFSTRCFSFDEWTF